MRSTFDRRVVSDGALALVRAVQRRIGVHLGGGAALSGAWLGHRLSRDLDLLCHAPEDVRLALRALEEAARELGAPLELVRDAGTLPPHRASRQQRKPVE